MAGTSLNLGGINWKSSNSKTPYTDIYNKYADYAKQSRKAYVQGVDAQLKTDQATTNAQYNNNARQYYIQNMQQQKSLPGQLATNGVTGGASESAIIRMNNAYGNNLATNESGRASSLNNLQTTRNNTVAEYDKTYYDNLANAYKTAAENQLTYEKEQRENDLKYFANSISNRYNSSKSWKKAIAKLKKSKGPNAKYKVALAQQAFTNWKISKKKSSGSGGGGSSSGSRSRSSGRSYSSGSGYNNYTATSTRSSTKPKKSKSSKSSKSSKKSKSKGKTYLTSWRINGL